MRERTPGRGTGLVAAVLLAAVGAAAFWTWRERAPLSRSYRRAKRRRNERRTERTAGTEREPGTDPV